MKPNRHKTVMFHFEIEVFQTVLKQIVKYFCLNIDNELNI